jgi:hypothetical protein
MSINKENNISIRLQGLKKGKVWFGLCLKRKEAIKAWK